MILEGYHKSVLDIQNRARKNMLSYQEQINKKVNSKHIKKSLIVKITMRDFYMFKYYSFNKLCITLVASIYFAIDFP